jgi:hypothetical protein
MLHATALARTYCRIRLGWKPGMATICVWGSDRQLSARQGLRDLAQRLDGRRVRPDRRDC